MWYAIRHRRRDDELREEMALHREMRQQELEAGGVARGDAEPAAHRVSGSSALAADHSRDVWIPPASTSRSERAAKRRSDSREASPRRSAASIPIWHPRTIR
jgi:hypothetical protein